MEKKPKPVKAVPIDPEKYLPAKREEQPNGGMLFTPEMFARIAAVVLDAVVTMAWDRRIEKRKRKKGRS